MDIDPLSDPAPVPDPAPRPATLRMMHAIGARLRRPLEPSERDALAVALAAAAAGSGGAAGAVIAGQGSARPGDGRGASARPDGAPSSPRRASRWMGSGRRRVTVAVAALAVLAGAVGTLTRSAGEPPVIVLAAGGPGGAGLTGGAAPAAALSATPGDARMAETSPMIGLWTPTRYRFVLADGLVLDQEPAAAWRLVPPADVAALAARLATAFGLPEPAPSEWDPTSFVAQAEDGANLWVAPSGDWYYGGPSDLWPVWGCPEAPAVEPRTEPAAGEGAAPASGDDAAPVAVECTPPAPPAGVPSAERARELAQDVMAGLGIEGLRVSDVHADEWGAWVSLERELPDGGTTGLAFGAGFMGDERLSHANGTFATLERLGDYPLISAADALVRLEEESNAWLDGGAVPMPLPAPMPETADRSADSAEGAPDVADAPVTILPVPGEGGGEQVEPVDREVRIVAIERTAMLVWTADERTVLLPHYRLTDADGGWWFVIAVEDRYLSR